MMYRESLKSLYTLDGYLSAPWHKNWSPRMKKGLIWKGPQKPLTLIPFYFIDDRTEAQTNMPVANYQ